MRPILVIGTGNPGKLREYARMLRTSDWDLRSLDGYPGAPEVCEDGASFAANAREKALAYARHSGEVALADDSGLEVDALGGAPGLHSARYAGVPANSAANIAKLLAALQGVAPERRTARFRCVVAAAAPDGAWVFAEGTCEGAILEVGRGASGFGYDPVFWYPPAGKSFAEMTDAEKDAVSHRARALASLRPRLLAFVAGHA